MSDKRSIVEDRPVSASEVELITWLLLEASTIGDATHLLPTISDLHVVKRCGCGCPTVEFAWEGQLAAPATIVADAYGETEDGVSVGILLWAHGNQISELELYEQGGPVRSLPSSSSLRPMFPT
ncbi:MAG: hypothetical protein PF636_05445 [Actinomycetota bacterium]|nr:hypothetical protein [Actinomycetota bacterium]